ncbi:MAG: hypothetical protein ACO1RX_13430 [Candidatus Sericytochromatia bacterium]
MKRLLLLPLLSILFFSAAAAPAPAHRLQAAQVRLLKALQVPVMVPGYVPAICEARRLEASYEPPGVGGGPGFELEYLCLPKQGEPYAFTLRGSTGGFGGPSGDKMDSVTHPTLGKVSINLFVPGGQQAIELPYFYSDWAGKGPLYFSLSSGDDVYPHMPLAEARKVLQSLRPLP